VEEERVLHLAAQTLQSLFLGGGSARVHAEFALADVTLLVPVQHPPTVRIFDGDASFQFANATAVVGPEARIAGGLTPLALFAHLAAVVGADERIAGYSVFAEWRAESLEAPKDRDFALGLGPVVTTVDELDPGALAVTVRVAGTKEADGRMPPFDWEAAAAFAGAGTRLRPGDLLVGPVAVVVTGVVGEVEVEVEGIGVLPQTIA
jgi:hypothetical protein